MKTDTNKILIQIALMADTTCKYILDVNEKSVFMCYILDKIE